MIKVGSRVIVPNHVVPVFRNMTGEVVEIQEGTNHTYYVVDPDPEFLAIEEVVGRLQLNKLLLGDYLFVTRDDEAVLIDNVASTNPTLGFKIGDCIKVVNCFDDNANGLVGIIRKLDDVDVVVEFNPDDTSNGLLKTLMNMNKMVFGFYGLPIGYDEMEFVE